MKTILWGDMYDKKISAAAIAVIMSASMMFTTASADASYVLDKDAGEDFVNFIDGKLPDILKSMDSVADGDKIYFDYGSWLLGRIRFETDSTVYKTDGKEVSESEYYNYKSTLSRFIPLEVENTELTSDETAKADADKLLEMYNEYNCVVMTAENKKDDMTSVIVEMNDLLKEMMVDVPSEIADDVDWSYNSWFEDLNFDGVPDFVIGGIADLLDEGTALRLYDVIGMGNAGFLADTNVSNDHGDGENGFGFKPYVNKQTGEKTYLSEDRYAYELSVTISTMGENKVPNNEGTLTSISFDVVGGQALSRKRRTPNGAASKIIIPIRQQIRQQVRRQALQPQ